MIQLAVVIDIVIVYSSFCNMVLLKIDVSSHLGWVLGVSLRKAQSRILVEGMGVKEPPL